MPLHPYCPPDPHRYRAIAPKPPEGPLPLLTLLPGTGEVELEIGFGHGLFLYERAAVRPEARILGLEVKRKWAYLVAERCVKRGLSNVTVWAADARGVLARVPDQSVARVFMHFPDPWWKQRHLKRSLVGETLLDDIARILLPHGELFLQTDVAERAKLHLEAVAQHARFELGGAAGYLDENPYGARSNREARAAEDGLPVYRTLAKKRGGGDPG
ncbi:MAG: tRNA (guanine46-N7-)-methyltransferase [Myxococcaceae bacterium]|nr:tRNA (guanine46-N7-)-methyltransferase [Myxococcaceae bacterium]